MTTKKAARNFLSAVSLLVGFSLTAINPGAATNVVLKGESLQQKIDAAAAGDLLVIQSGDYSGAISVTKPLSFVRSGSEVVNIMSPVSINTTGTVTFAEMAFHEEFIAQSSTNLDLRVYDTRFAKSVVVDNAKLTLKRTTIAGNLTTRSSDVDALRATITGSFVATGPTGGASRVFVVQSKVVKIMSTIDCKTWVGYSALQILQVERGEIVMVGTDVYNNPSLIRAYHAPYYYAGLLRDCKYQIYNSRVCWIGNYFDGEVAGLQIVNSEGIIQNCDIIANGAGYPGLNGRHSSGVVYWGGKSTVRNCFFEISAHNACSALTDHQSSALLKFTDSIVRASDWYYGTPSGYSTIRLNNTSTPINVRDEANLGVTITYGAELNIVQTSESKLKNAGSTDPLDKNVDGTRNTIGSTGGPLYHPENKTTDRPIAFWLMTTPRRILKGTDSTIKVDAAAASGH